MAMITWEPNLPPLKGRHVLVVKSVELVEMTRLPGVKLQIKIPIGTHAPLTNVVCNE